MSELPVVVKAYPEWFMECGPLSDVLVLNDDIETCLAEIERLREALKFYAEPQVDSNPSNPTTVPSTEKSLRLLKFLNHRVLNIKTPFVSLAVKNFMF